MDRSYLQTLKARLVLSDVVSAFVKLTRKGHEMWGCCPFHQEKTPSFKVNNEQGTFHCFGCGAGGDVIAFWQDKTGASFVDTVRELSQKAGLTLPQNFHTPEMPSSPLYAPLDKASDIFHEALDTPSGKMARGYLHKRGIPETAIKTFSLGVTPPARVLHDGLKSFSEDVLIEAGLFSNKKGPLTPHFKHRLMFPLRDVAGHTVGFGGRTLSESTVKYMNSPETAVFSKKTFLYGLYEARKNQSLRTQPVVLVEGYFDVIALQTEGLARAMAPLGTAISAEQLKSAFDLSPAINVCFDGDTAGLMAAFKLAERALPFITPDKTLHFTWLPRGEDPQSMIGNGRTQDLAKRLQTPHPLVDVLFNFLVHLYPARTPESRVKAKQHILKWCALITASDLANHYRRDLLDKLWQHIKGPNIRNPVAEKPTIPNPEHARLRREAIILLTLINHPALLFDHMERLALLSFSKENAVFLSHLLGLTSRWDLPPTPDTFKETVRTEVPKLLSILENTPYLLLYAPFARPTSDKTAAHKGLLDLLDYFIQNDGLRRDILEAEASFAQNLHEDAWRRLRELREIYRQRFCETSEGV